MDLVWLKNTTDKAVMLYGKYLEPGDCRQVLRSLAERTAERSGGALVIVDALRNEAAGFTSPPAGQHVGNYRGPHR